MEDNNELFNEEEDVVLEENTSNSFIEDENSDFLESEKSEKSKKEKKKKVKTSVTDTNVKDSMNRMYFILTGVITVLVIAVLVFFGVRYYTVPNTEEKMNPGNVAVTIGETDISIGMYNYYYTAVVNQYKQNASYGYNNLDVSKPFDEQTTTDDDGNEITWADYFVDQTIQQIKYITSYYERAVNSGTKLTKDQKSTIDSNLASLTDAAADADKSVDSYIAETYGDYCGYQTLKKMLTQAYLAQNYYYEYSVESTPTASETEDYFGQHKEDYYVVDVAYLPISYTSKTKEKTVSNAEKYVKQIKTKKDMKTLIPKIEAELIEQYVSGGYASSKKEAIEAISSSMDMTVSQSDKDTIGEDAYNWLISDSTKVGEVKFFEDAYVADSYSYGFIIMKTGDKEFDESEVYSVRHILISPESSDSSESSSSESKSYTEAEWDAAEEKANEILKEWQDGKKTEYSFAQLAEKYSADTNSTSAGSSGIYGGLYSGVTKGTMVKSFENWSLEKTRKYGDVDIVKSDYGFHIMFFVNKQAQYLYNAEQALMTEKENSAVDNTKVKKHSLAMKKTKVAKPESSDSSEQTTNDTSSSEGTEESSTEETTSAK